MRANGAETVDCSEIETLDESLVCFARRSAEVEETAHRAKGGGKRGLERDGWEPKNHHVQRERYLSLLTILPVHSPLCYSSPSRTSNDFPSSYPAVQCPIPLDLYISYLALAGGAPPCAASWRRRTLASA